MANYAPRKPQIGIGLSYHPPRSRSKRRAAGRVTLHTISKVSTDLRNDFIGKNSHGSQGQLSRAESDMPRLDIRGSTVFMCFFPTEDFSFFKVSLLLYPSTTN